MADAAFPTAQLEGYADVTVVRPGIDWYVARLREGRPFAFVKRTHGFWDRVVDLADFHAPFGALCDEARRRDDDAFPSAREIEDALRLDPATQKRLDERKRFKGFWEGRFAIELLAELRAPHADPRWLEGNAFRGYSRSDEKPALHDVGRLREVFLALRSRRLAYHDALVFKDGIVDGGFLRVLDAVRPMRSVLVGPPHLARFAALAGLPRMEHLEIHPTAAIRDREKILKACLKVVRRRAAGEPLALVLQAGSLSWWLMYRLFPEAPDVYFLDVGRTLDVWFPEIVTDQPWFRIDRDAIVRNMGLARLYGG
jgi:hypothetical protein